MQKQQIDSLSQTTEQCALRFTATMSPLKAPSLFYDASFDYFVLGGLNVILDMGRFA